MMITRRINVGLIIFVLVISVFGSVRTAYAACPPTAEDPVNTCPTTSDSAAFSRQGIFGCNRNNAALSGSVGAFSATGGVYVPVADYTTELNTGTLVYMFCVLNGIVNRQSEAAATALIRQTIVTLTTGNDGNPLFEVNPRTEKRAEGDRVALLKIELIRDTEDSVTRAGGGAVTQAVARTYMAERQPLKDLLCPFDIDLTACKSGQDLSDACKNAISDTRCYDDFAYYYRKEYVYDEIAEALDQRQRSLDRSGGFYDVSRVDENGDRIIETPGSIVQETGAQALTSGFRRIENADSVDEMVGALYAGLGQQSIANTGGLLSGLTSAIGGQQSYLNQMTAESSAGLRNAAANAALQVLAGARQIEVQYNNAINDVANTLTTAISQLRSLENQCLGLIAYSNVTPPVPHVCTAAPVNSTCTAVSGGNLTRVATSSRAFSDPIVNSRIVPIANQIVQNVQKSNQALALIDQLIAGVTNTASLDAQRLALVQLDQMVSRGQLHVQADVTAITQQQSAVSDSMVTLVDQTKLFWADNTTLDLATGSGWCNVHNPAVITTWTDRWR